MNGSAPSWQLAERMSTPARPCHPVTSQIEARMLGYNSPQDTIQSFFWQCNPRLHQPVASVSRAVCGKPDKTEGCAADDEFFDTDIYRMAVVSQKTLEMQGRI